MKSMKMSGELRANRELDFLQALPGAEAAAFRRRLTAWYRQAARDLPWRKTRDPYRIWISETMLQQTQVVKVIDYYQRFLARFPDVESLARASEQTVLRAWEGLGYYRRARQLHLAAQLIVSEHGGRFPDRAEAVRNLPGIGRYTAGAILSIAFDQPRPIIEANTERVWARLLAHEGDLKERPGQAVLWHAATEVLPRRGSRTINQALMELGSLLCTPRNPKCDECPVRLHCRARALQKQETIPPPKVKTSATLVREAALVLRRGERFFLHQRGAEERWAGMWDFPRIDLEGGTTFPRKLSAAKNTASSLKRLEFSTAYMQDGFERRLGMAVVKLLPLTTLKYSVTRYRVTMECFEGRLSASNGSAKQKSPHRELEGKWFSRKELAELPLPIAGRRLADFYLRRMESTLS